MAPKRALESPGCYTVAWITILPVEKAAAIAMLDEQHERPIGFTRHQRDTNVYSWGSVGKHNVVLVSLPAGDYGNVSAASTAWSLVSSLPSIRIGLLVGTGGGIPRPEIGRDIRLGDIVVSQPNGLSGGIYQYDTVKALPGDKLEHRGFLGRPPTVLLNALTSIQAHHEMEDSRVPQFLRDMVEKNPKMASTTKQNSGYLYPGSEKDRLFAETTAHNPESARVVQIAMLRLKLSAILEPTQTQRFTMGLLRQAVHLSETGSLAIESQPTLGKTVFALRWKRPV